MNDQLAKNHITYRWGPVTKFDGYCWATAPSLEQSLNLVAVTLNKDPTSTLQLPQLDSEYHQTRTIRFWVAGGSSG